MNVNLLFAVAEFKLDATYRVDVPGGVLAFADKVAGGARSAISEFEALKDTVLKHVVEFAGKLRAMNGKLRTVLDALPSNLTTAVTSTFPRLVQTVSGFMGKLSGLVSDSKAVRIVSQESGLFQLAARLEVAVDAVATRVQNSTFTTGLRQTITQSEELLSNAVGLVQYMAYADGISGIINGSTTREAGLLRTAEARRAAKCAERGADAIACPNDKPSVAQAVLSAAARLRDFFAVLASDNVNSAANRLHGAIKRGDMGAAIAVVASSTASVPDYRDLASVLAKVAQRQYNAAMLALATLAAGTSDAQPAAAEALTLLETNQTHAAMRVLAGQIAGDDDEVKLQLLAMVEVDATQWAADQAAAASTDPTPTTNSLQGIRDFVVPLVGLTSALADSKSHLIGNARRGRSIDAALEALGTIADSASRQSTHLMPTTTMPITYNTVVQLDDGLPNDVSSADANWHSHRVEASLEGWSIGQVVRQSCSLSVADGLVRELIYELQQAGYPLTELSGPRYDATLGGAANVGIKCITPSCIPYLLAPAGAQLLEASRRAAGGSTNDVMLMSAAYRSTVHQHILYSWQRHQRCGVLVADRPGESAYERGLVVAVPECEEVSMRKQGHSSESRACQRRKISLEGADFVSIGLGQFMYRPAVEVALVAVGSICDADAETTPLGIHRTPLACAEACVAHGFGCVVFTYKGVDSIHMHTSVGDNIECYMVHVRSASACQGRSVDASTRNT